MTIGSIGDGTIATIPDCMPGDSLTQDASGNYVCITPTPTVVGGTLNLSLPTILIPIGLLVAFAVMGARK